MNTRSLDQSLRVEEMQNRSSFCGWVIFIIHSLFFRALKLGYLTQDMIDDYEPALMFTIPRLAIVW